jgi:hypothetical protein
MGPALNRRLAWLLAGLALPIAGVAAAATPAVQADHEIQALIDALPASDCRFQRNGRWYDGAAAADHLRRKYAWLRQRGMVDDSAGFIALAASRSSVSGRPYRVACPGQPERDAADWFGRQLARQRRHETP